MDIYETVGVDKNASKEKIKKAYRKKAMTMHPDHGGDPVKFKALVLSYNILFDDEKRARYDAGESADDITRAVRSEDQQILDLVLGLFVGAVGAADPNTNNITTMISDQIKRTMMEIHNLIEAEKFKIKKFESAIKRMKTTSTENIFSKTASSKIEDFNRQIERLKVQEKIGEGALKFLESYSYEIDEQIMQITFGTQQQAFQNGAFR